MTALICAVASFPIGALSVVTQSLRQSDPLGAAILCSVTAAIGMTAGVAILLVHGRDVRSPYVLLGLLPALGSAAWILTS
ncbi:MAG: hypothetical protein QOJ72_2103 [Nocardioidaceae bacterium]|nr:hypothetical protein [Nocardioidaceae bacterium]